VGKSSTSIRGQSLLRNSLEKSKKNRKTKKTAEEEKTFLSAGPCL